MRSLCQLPGDFALPRLPFGRPFSYTLEDVFGPGPAAPGWGAPNGRHEADLVWGSLENGFWQPTAWLAGTPPGLAPVPAHAPARPVARARARPAACTAACVGAGANRGVAPNRGVAFRFWKFDRKSHGDATAMGNGA